VKAKKRTKKGSLQAGKGQGSSLGFYSLTLLASLAAAAVAQVALTVVLPAVGAEALSQPINGLLAILYAWILAGLTVCVLLFAWLRFKPVGVGLSVLVLGLWLVGLRKHLQSPCLSLFLLPLIGGGAAFWAGLRYTSRHLLPIFDQAQASKAFDFLKKHLWSASRPGYILTGADETELSATLSGDSSSEKRKGRPSFVFTGCDRAVAISDKLQLKGVRDPGLVFIRSGEKMTQIIDLRPQVRPFSLTGRTQDGIQVRVRASVAFRIDAGRRKPQLGEAMPFSKAAAFKAVHAQRVEHETDRHLTHASTPRLWDDLPSIRGKHILRDIVSKLSFDELYGPHQLDGEPPRRQVREALHDRLGAALERVGIQLLHVDLGNFEPVDPQVYVKRARNWQTEWIRRITVRQAEGQVERLQILERARADARTELILDVGRQLEKLAESRADLGPDTVLDQFLVVLETLMTRPRLKDALPKHTRDLLSDMRDAMGE